MVGLEDSARNWSTDAGDIKQLIISYFQEIFTTCSPTNIESITDCVQPRVTMQLDTANFLRGDLASREIFEPYKVAKSRWFYRKIL